MIPFKQEFIAVGQTTLFSSENTDDVDTTEILYSKFDITCNISAKRTIGFPGIGPKNKFNQIGTDVTRRGSSIYITGYEQYFSGGSTTPEEKPIYLKTSPDGTNESLMYLDFGSRSVGKSIFWRKSTKSLLIAGETRTNVFIGKGDPEAIFLAEFTPPFFNNVKVELFGTGTSDDSVVDLTLSQDKNVVMLSNSFDFIDLYQDTKPWIIERYDDIAQQCRDAPYQVSLQYRPVQSTEAHENSIRISTYFIDLVTVDVIMDNIVTCPKMEV